MPKTFKDRPIISLTLEDKRNGVIIPTVIENIKPYEFTVKLPAITKHNDHFLHTTALSPSVKSDVGAVHYDKYPYITCSDNAVLRHDIQRFYTQVQEETDEVEIFFPFGFADAPVVNVTIEGPNNIVPYAISSVNNSSYKIIFGTTVDQNYTIHTFSSVAGEKRLAL